MVSVYKITLDTQKSAYQAILDGCRRGDTGTRKVEIQLTHSGKPLRPPEGCIVTMWVTLPSGHVSYSTCGVESGVISHLFRTTELAEEGDALCEVRVTDENGSVLTSPRFKVRVDDTLQDDEALESTNEYSALTEAMAGLEEKKEAAQAAAGRHERPEWAAVGLVGQLVVIDDGTSVVNGYCKVTDSGTGTQSEERTAYRVMERLDADHIRIFLR